MSAVRCLTAIFTLAIATTATCGEYSDLKVEPGEWRTLAPGQPRTKFPTVRIIEEGKGPGVELGDLIKLNYRSKMQRGGPDSNSEPSWHDWGDWWIWIGFLTDKETPLFSNELRLSSALIGLREGTVFEFVDANDDPTKDATSAGTLYTNIIGSHSEYRWRKNLQNDTMPVEPSSPRGDNQLRILLTCKANLQIRTVHYFDDSPVRVWQGFDTHLTQNPRELWIDEGRIQGKCSNGRTATFRYGPLATGGRSPVIGYFDNLLKDEWEKLPVGVQTDNNRPPTVPDIEKYGLVTTPLDTPVKINVLERARDPDGDRLTARIVREPKHGKLIANADGSFTYIPENGWQGIDEFNYKASDGMIESNLGEWHVSVEREAPTSSWGN